MGILKKFQYEEKRKRKRKRKIEKIEKIEKRKLIFYCDNECGK